MPPTGCKAQRRNATPMKQVGATQKGYEQSQATRSKMTPVAEGQERRPHPKLLRCPRLPSDLRAASDDCSPVFTSRRPQRSQSPPQQRSNTHNAPLSNPAQDLSETLMRVRPCGCARAGALQDHCSFGCQPLDVWGSPTLASRTFCKRRTTRHAQVRPATRGVLLLAAVPAIGRRWQVDLRWCACAGCFAP